MEDVSQDLTHALLQVAENADSLRVSLAKGFLVGGDSAGGNLTAAITLKARDDPFFAEKPITGQYLREPAVVHPLAWPEKYGRGYYAPYSPSDLRFAGTS